MENILKRNAMFGDYVEKDEAIFPVLNLSQAKMNTVYMIKDINTEDEELKNFLFTLGCYKGEEVTVISVLSENFTICIKDARYSIDRELAEAIIV